VPGINWGIANDTPQPVLSPGANKKERMKSGDPVPSRPAWLCITSPEYAVSPTIGRDEAVDLTVEELDAIEAEQIEKDKVRDAKVEERKLEAEAARDKKKAMDAMEKKAREERAKANKAVGHHRGKREVKIVYHNRQERGFE